MKKRLFAFLLVCLTVFTLFGCENVEYREPSQEEQSSREEIDTFEQLESILPPIETEEELPPEREFKILTSSPSSYISDENSPKTINTAIEKRNELLSRKYGAKITAVAVEEDKAEKLLKDAELAGNEVCDLISLSAKTTVGLYIKGLLGDMNKLPDLNLDSEFFDGQFAKALATNSSLYLLPDASTLPFEEAYVMFFNRELILNSGAENPESLAAQGVWTWDKFNEIARATAFEVYKKSSADLEKDIFGYSAYYMEKDYPTAMWVSCGRKIIDNNYKNPIEFSVPIDDIVDMTAKLRGYYNTKGKYPLQGDDSAKAFEENRIVFFCNKLEYLYALRDGTTKGSQFGFVPMPKYSEEQNGYSCLLDSDASLLSIPKTAENADDSKRKFVSAVINGISATSRKTVKDAFVNYYIAQYLNTNTETVMLKTITDSITFDFGTVYGNKITEIRRVLVAPITDYLDYGSGLRNSFANAMNSFKRYASENFA